VYYFLIFLRIDFLVTVMRSSASLLFIYKAAKHHLLDGPGMEQAQPWKFTYYIAGRLDGQGTQVSLSALGVPSQSLHDLLEESHVAGCWL